jgi:putative membrane protein
MWKPGWRQQGQEPDYRFSLANERTFLAWIRTALSLLAGGVLLEQFASNLEPHAALVALAVLLATVSATLSAVAYLRWRANEIAMRHARPLQASLALPLMAVTTLLVSGAIALLLLMS